MKILRHINLVLIPAICIALAGSHYCSAQDVIAPAACYFKTASLSVNWTIGEIATETFVNDNIMLTQGFNQGNITITATSEDLFADLNISVYPNPVKNIFTIKSGPQNSMQLKAELYNLSGAKLISQKIESGNTPVNMERFPESEYILKIFNNLQEIKTFKVIKTN
jgi:hypothetical protein